MKLRLPHTSFFRHFIALSFILLSVFSFGQANTIEERFRIDELNQKIKKNTEKIESLEASLDMLETIESNLITNANLDEAAIKREIELFRQLNVDQPIQIEKRYYAIEDQMAHGIVGFRQTIDRYEQTSNGDVDLLIFLSDLASNVRNVYPIPDFILNPYDQGMPEIDAEKFIAYQSSLTLEKLSQDYTRIIAEINEPIVERKKKMTAEIVALEESGKEFREESVKLQVDLEGKTAYDRTVIKWGFPIFIFFILAIYLVPLWYVYKRENLDGQRTENLYRMIYGSGLVTEIITVFLLTSTILLLGITDKLAPEILGTLIGGISGYVLGRSFNNSEIAKKKITEQNQE